MEPREIKIKDWDFNLNIIDMSSLVKWNLFDSMFPNYYDFRTPMWSDWKETKEGLQIKVVVPGYEKEDFNLYVEDGSLRLEISRETDHLSYSIFSRWSSPRYDLEAATAEYKNGILTLKIPRLEKEPKRLAIKVS